MRERAKGDGSTTVKRGDQLRRLREFLNMSQELLSQTSGLTRPEISNAEHDRTKWHSERLWTALCKGFGIDRDTLKAYIEGLVTVERAAAAARPSVELARRRANRDRSCDLAVREAMGIAGMLDYEHAPSIFLLLQVIARREGPSVSTQMLADKALICREHIEEAIRACLSHKSVSEMLRGRR